MFEPGELIVAIDLPPARVAAKSRYLKIRDRASYAFALVSAAVALDVQNGRIRDARIGDGRSTYETGVVSRINETARRLELREGMSAREAVARLLGLG